MNSEKPAEKTAGNVETQPEAQPETQLAPAAITTTMTPKMAGKKVYARCRSCHTIQKGGRHRVGPNLYGIFGRTSGTMEGFAYSKAMVAANITWTDETIAAYLANPRTYIPKNKCHLAA